MNNETYLLGYYTATYEFEYTKSEHLQHLLRVFHMHEKMAGDNNYTSTLVRFLDILHPFRRYFSDDEYPNLVSYLMANAMDEGKDVESVSEYLADILDPNEVPHLTIWTAHLFDIMVNLNSYEDDRANISLSVLNDLIGARSPNHPIQGLYNQLWLMVDYG